MIHGCCLKYGRAAHRSRLRACGGPESAHPLTSASASTLRPSPYLVRLAVGKPDSDRCLLDYDPLGLRKVLPSPRGADAGGLKRHMRIDYVLKRVGMLLILVWVAATLNFVAPRL